VQRRTVVIKNLDLGGNGASLPSMAIYESGTIRNLAKRLFGLRTGTSQGEAEDELKLMDELIKRHSILPKLTPPK
jgi:hypothetical protein